MGWGTYILTLTRKKVSCCLVPRPDTRRTRGFFESLFKGSRFLIPCFPGRPSDLARFTSPKSSSKILIAKLQGVCIAARMRMFATCANERGRADLLTHHIERRRPPGITNRDGERERESRKRTASVTLDAHSIPRRVGRRGSIQRTRHAHLV